MLLQRTKRINLKCLIVVAIIFIQRERVFRYSHFKLEIFAVEIDNFFRSPPVTPTNQVIRASNKETIH